MLISESVEAGPAGDSAGVLSRYNFHHKAVKHLALLEANLPQVRQGPVSVVIHPTNACNARCPQCRYADLRQAHETIPFETLAQTIKQLAALGTRSIILSGGGEPTIYAGLTEVIELAASRGLKIGLVTNLLRLSEALLQSLLQHLDWVRVSINAAGPAAYQVVQGMKPQAFHRLRENLAELVRRRDANKHRLVIGGSFIVQKGNYREAGEFLDFAQNLGLDYVIYRPVQKWSETASLQAGSLGLTPEELLTLERLIDQKLSDRHHRKSIPHNLDKVVGLFSQFEEPKSYPRCLSTYVEAAIGGDGRVYPCCQHVGNPRFSAGALAEQSFAEIWTGAGFQRVREMITPAHCPPCRYHFYNLVFNRFVAGWRPTPAEQEAATQTADVDFL